MTRVGLMKDLRSGRKSVRPSERVNAIEPRLRARHQTEGKAPVEHYRTHRMRIDADAIELLGKGLQKGEAKLRTDLVTSGAINVPASIMELTPPGTETKAPIGSLMLYFV